MLALSKLEAFADDNFNMAQIVQFLFGYQHFLLFPQCFQKTSLSAMSIAESLPFCNHFVVNQIESISCREIKCSFLLMFTV